MATKGARVVGFDFSEPFIHRARSRTPSDLGIEYHVIDATDRKAITDLGSARFDGATATMALMDISSIDPLLAALRVVLKSRAWFVFSVLHPCFLAPESSRFAECQDGKYPAVTLVGVKLTRYLTPAAFKAEGIVGQPEPQYYFHRPLHVLFSACFAQGFVIDGLEEPRLTPAASDGRELRWDNMSDIPPVLVVRARLVGKQGA
jgi:SAM-dependent methyltransferase